jgi:hypothetical protein
VGVVTTVPSRKYERWEVFLVNLRTGQRSTPTEINDLIAAARDPEATSSTEQDIYVDSCVARP